MRVSTARRWSRSTTPATASGGAAALPAAGGQTAATLTTRRPELAAGELFVSPGMATTRISRAVVDLGARDGAGSSWLA